MIKKVIDMEGFIPDDTFREFILSLGYSQIDIIKRKPLQYDEKIIEYIENHRDGVVPRIKGKETSDRLIGFYGHATVLEIDTDRKWQIRYNNCDQPYISYINPRIETDEYGQTHVYVNDGH